MRADFKYNIISVEELWAFFNLSNNFFCIIGTDGQLRHANPAFIRASGYTEEELYSRPYTDFMHPEEFESSVNRIMEVSKGDPAFSYQSRFRTKDNGYRWFAWTAVSSAEDGIVYATGEDCTENKKIEDELERLSLVAKKTMNGITIADKDRRIMWVNESFTKITGYSLEEVRGKRPLEVLGGPLTSTDSDAFIEEQIQNGRPFLKEAINYKKNGEPFWMRVEGQPIFDEKGEPIKWIAMQTNITKQKLAEETIMTNEKKYRSIFDNSPLPTFIYDPHSLQILEVNKAAIHNYGYSLGEFMHLTFNDLKSEKDPSVMQQMMELINGETFHDVCKHKKKNGDVILADTTASVIEYKNRSAVLLIVKDITEKNRLREELMEEKLNKEKNLLEATLHGQELERVEIGKELHDNINQILSTVKLYLDMSLGDKKNSTELIKKSTGFLITAIQEIRALSKTLVAPGVNDLVLSESIEALIATIAQNKSIHIDFQPSKGLDELPPKIKLTLFRIVQEQLNNIIKHANAKNASITITNGSGNIRMTIQDDGKGFDTSKKKNGIGLINIISRVEVYKGTVIIESAPGKGCLLEVNIPSSEIFKIAV